MSTSTTLNLLALALSVFNTIVLLWLGLTILLNAERRVLGVWLVGGSLVLAAFFFVSHTVILQRGVAYPDWQFRFWWKAGVLPAHLLPYAWYMVMLWYAGFWQSTDSPLRRRHRRPGWLTTLLMVVGLGLLVAIPASSESVGEAGLVSAVAPGGRYARPFVILLAIGFSGYILLCLTLALDVVRRPGPASRIMGDLARRRAQPWLAAATGFMLGVTLLVTWSLMWISRNLLDGSYFLWQPRTFNVLAVFDVAILLLLTGASILVGQAAVAYEIFTGQTLPRQGLRRQWRLLLLFGGFYSVAVGGLLVFDLPPVLGLLLLTLASTGFAALLAWRAYAERERTMRSLRPFVANPRLVDQLLSERAGHTADIRPAFEALCRDVLGAPAAFLFPRGSAAALVDRPLAYPDTQPPPPLDRLPGAPVPGGPLCFPVDRTLLRGGGWGIPLWNERGLIGLLLLGNRPGDALYTQEEIEIARASGERMIDTLAGAEIARRLVALQRDRMVQSQLLDQRTRRVLHDDVLPQLHTAMLGLADHTHQIEILDLLQDAHKRIADLLRELPAAAVEPVQTHGLWGAIERLVAEEMDGTFDTSELQADEAARARMAHLPPLTADVLYHAVREAVRNAARHGRGAGSEQPLHLSVRAAVENGLTLTIADDGVGGASGGDGGHGLTLHGTLMAVVGGELAVDSEPGRGTRVRLWIGSWELGVRS